VNTHDPSPGDGTAAALALTALQNDFPQFRIWSEKTQGGCRYIARSRRLSQNPHTLITPDPAELRAALSAALTPDPHTLPR
jgi:hypothetical protein